MLNIPAILWREIEERTRLALPEEACGLLLGMRRGGEVEVAALAPGRNLAPSAATHFELDPLDLLAAEDGARAIGLSILGVWHSHPRGPIGLSAEDRRGAQDGWLTLIAVPRPGMGLDLGCWRTTAGGHEVVSIGQPVGAQR